MPLRTLLLRARNIPAGGMLTVSLAEDGPGAGSFCVEAGMQRGLRISSALGDPLAFDRFAVAPQLLQLVASANTDMLEIQLQAFVHDLSLRGFASTPRGGTLRITTAYDHTSVVDQSSWWVLFDAEFPDPRGRFGSGSSARPAPPPAPAKEASAKEQ